MWAPSPESNPGGRLRGRSHQPAPTLTAGRTEARGAGGEHPLQHPLCHWGAVTSLYMKYTFPGFWVVSLPGKTDERVSEWSTSPTTAPSAEAAIDIHLPALLHILVLSLLVSLLV